MAKVGIRALRKYLQTLSEEDLQQEVVTLFRQLKQVKEYYQVQLGDPEDDHILEKYKAIIQKEFSVLPRGIGKARVPVARQAVADYKKLGAAPEKIVDLMIHYVEVCADFTNFLGDIDESFYNSMASIYEQATTIITEHGLHEQFESRCRVLIREVSGFGWGITEALEYHFNMCFRK